MESVRSAAKSVTPMSGPNMNLHVHKASGERGAGEHGAERWQARAERASDLPSQQKVCEPSHDCHTLVLWLVEWLVMCSAIMCSARMGTTALAWSGLAVPRVPPGARRPWGSRSK